MRKSNNKASDQNNVASSSNLFGSSDNIEYVSSRAPGLVKPMPASSLESRQYLDNDEKRRNIAGGLGAITASRRGLSGQN